MHSLEDVRAVQPRWGDTPNWTLDKVSRFPLSTFEAERVGLC